MSRNFELFVVPSTPWDRIDDNVDVEVLFPSGERYSATFFTLRNLHSLFEKNRRTEECLSGAYFWASDMILVEELTIELMSRVIENLLEEGEFHSALSRLSDTNDGDV